MKLYENKMFAGRSKMTVILFAAITVVLVVVFITGFINEERTQRLEATKLQLTESAERAAAIVHNLFDGYVNTLRSIAIYLKNFDDLTSAEALGYLEKAAESFEFDRLSIDFPDGRSYTTDGLFLHVTREYYIESIKSGQVFITDATRSIIDGAPIVCIHIPILKDGSPVASLSYALNRERLNGLLRTLLSEEGTYFYIIDGYGKYVAFDGDSRFSPDNNFLSDVLDMHTYGAGFSKELIIEAFANGEAGHTEYSFEDGAFRGEKRYGYYSPVGINNWMIMSVMSKNAIDADTNKFLTNAFTLAAQLLFVFLIVVFFVYIEQEKARETAQLDEQCLRILAEHTGKVVLEWDYGKKILVYPNFEKVVGQKPLRDTLRTADEAVEAGVVHPDDCDIYKEAVSTAAMKQAYEMGKRV